MKRFDNRYKFRSQEPYYTKERLGLKPNTIREIDEDDKRFIELMEHCTDGFLNVPLKIEIVNSINSAEYFVREITDITVWNDLMIISWKHEQLSSKSKNLKEVKK